MADIYYNKQQLERCSPKLLELLWKQDSIYTANRGSMALEPIIAQIIRVSREEKHAFVYISAMCDMLFFEMTFNEVFKGIKYGELFLREARVIFEEALPTDSSPRAFQQNYILCYETIADLYMGFPQISTRKMEQFFELYKENMRLYGGEIIFYRCLLKWQVISQNIPEAKKLYLSFDTHPLIHQCYVCTYNGVNHARVLAGDLEGALAHCANVIAGNVPGEARAGYEKCERATAHSQYTDLLDECLFHGRLDFLDRVLPLAYREILADREQESTDCVEAIADGLYGNFQQLDTYVQYAYERLDEQRLYLPYEQMYGYLMLMAYFRMIPASGTLRVAFPTEKPIPLEPDSENRYSVLEIADYFEQLADGIGAQFEKSRDRFDYEGRKKCFLKLPQLHFTYAQ